MSLDALTAKLHSLVDEQSTVLQQIKRLKATPAPAAPAAKPTAAAKLVAAAADPARPIRVIDVTGKNYGYVSNAKRAYSLWKYTLTLPDKYTVASTHRGAFMEHVIKPGGRLVACGDFSNNTYIAAGVCIRVGGARKDWSLAKLVKERHHSTKQNLTACENKLKGKKYRKQFSMNVDFIGVNHDDFSISALESQEDLEEHGQVKGCIPTDVAVRFE
jgi:hypothetical protein